MTTTTMSGNQVAQAIGKMTGMKIPPDHLGLVSANREKIIHAIRQDDPEALTAYVTQAVASSLRGAGYPGSITPRALRAFVEAEGWTLVRDVVDGRENAAGVLQGKLQAINGGSQFATQRTNAAAAQPERQSPNTVRDRNEEPARVRREAPPAATDQRGHDSGRDRRDHPASMDSRETRPRPVGTAPHGTPPPRRHDNSNVRTIGTGRPGETDRPDRKTSKTYVYGGKSALMFEADVTRRAEAPTIRIESAKVLDPATRKIDWDKKVLIQCTTTELQHVTALLYGMIGAVKYSNHGPKNDKWFSMEHQEGQYAGTIKVAVGEGKEKLCITQITSADLGDVVALFTRQCALQMNVEQAALMSVLRPVAKAYNDAQNARRGSSQPMRRAS